MCVALHSSPRAYMLIFFPPFLGRHSQSHSFRWTNTTRHWRENSQLKINTSSNILFTFPVSLLIPKYPVGAGARWLTLMLLKFSHAYLVAAYGNLTLCGFFGGDIGMSHLLLLFAVSKLSCFQAELSPLEPSNVVVINPWWEGKYKDCLPSMSNFQ